jgi:hypothetical protein
VRRRNHLGDRNKKATAKGRSECVAGTVWIAADNRHDRPLQPLNGREKRIGLGTEANIECNKREGEQK